MNKALKNCDRIWLNARLATIDPAVEQPFGLLDKQALAVRDGVISAILPMSGIDPATLGGEVIDARGALLTPGLIDCHTHLLHGGQRANEFSLRLQGSRYEEIARAGGGIMATVRATRALSEEQLIEQSRPRLEALLAEGVTTLEIKSGYGLTIADELKMLRAATRLAAQYPVRVSRTLLAAHTIPPEFKEAADDYVSLIVEQLIPQVAEEKLAEAVDVFCETIAFNPAQTERIFVAAQQAGLAVKLHAEQLSNSHGSELAARYRAWSVDHLEYLDGNGIAAIKQSGTVATLLPGAFYFLGETRKPPVAALRQAQVPLALASDLNPGTSPLASLRLMLNLGAVLFGLTPEEALAGVTRHAATALGGAGCYGQLMVGQAADMLLWELDDPAQLVAQFGTPTPQQRIFAGEVSHA